MRDLREGLLRTTVSSGPGAARKSGWAVLAALAAATCLPGAPPGTTAGEPARGAGAAGLPSSLVLLTLDTTRSDHLGCYGARAVRTPNLDALAARGTRYARALTPSPLTLPAHCSLLTGFDPPEHGVRDNGIAVLPREIPTLATVLSARGYATGAFVSSRVLDRRFGLARGFDSYDDHMPAEHVGQYGYPERNADAVTTAALAWASALSPDRPYFLWVHYYDPHAPYTPPGSAKRASEQLRYAEEIAYMDRQIGRLLAALPGDPARRLVGAAGDHGEMLGEHGERGHGIFLYRASLEVPLILAGPAVPAGRVVSETVGIRSLAPTLLRLMGAREAAEQFGRPLPGLAVAAEGEWESPVYGEALLPASAYGWSPLRAVSDRRWRLILAPRAELYDFVADPGESRNLLRERPEEVLRLERALEALERGRKAGRARRPEPDAELAASLRSLGYLSGASGAATGSIDPKDGILMLAEFEQAKAWIGEGRRESALAKLQALVRRSPGNVPFLTRLAEAQFAIGRREDALASLRQAVALNPRLDLLRLQLADAFFGMGRFEKAREEYEGVLELDPRSARAWLGLAEIAHKAGRSGEERALLRRAEEAGTWSAAVLTRLAQLELAGGDTGAADRHLEAATRLFPRSAAAWWVWGGAAEKQGRLREAIARYVKGVALDGSDPAALLHLGRLLLKQGEPVAARRYLERAAIRGGQTAAGEEARRLLKSMP